MSTFDHFESRTEISAVLRMISALSVGSRASLEPTGSDLPVMRDPEGMPFIPGSSIKGVIRAHMERILRSLEQRHGLSACDPFEQPCVDSKLKDQLLRAANGKEAAFSQAVWEKSCTVCRLFGSPWFAGCLAFKDARLTNADNLPVVTQVRDGVGIDRDLGAAREGIKYDFEVVVPGAEFDIQILADNVPLWELGLLLAVLRPWQEGNLPIGGKSTRGPGWGRLEIRSIRRVERGDLLDYLLQGKAHQIDGAKCLESLRTKLGG